MKRLLAGAIVAAVALAPTGEGAAALATAELRPVCHYVTPKYLEQYFTRPRRAMPRLPRRDWCSYYDAASPRIRASGGTRREPSRVIVVNVDGPEAAQFLRSTKRIPGATDSGISRRRVKGFPAGTRWRAESFRNGTVGFAVSTHGHAVLVAAGDVHRKNVKRYQSIAKQVARHVLAQL